MTILRSGAPFKVPGTGGKKISGTISITSVLNEKGIGFVEKGPVGSDAIFGTQL
jgi:hypothetical protein